MRKADNLPPSCAVVTKSGNLNFLEPSGPVQACNGTASHAICCHLDCCNSLKSLSLVFYKLDILISTVQLHVQNTRTALSSLNVVPYQHISNGKCQDVPLN